MSEGVTAEARSAGDGRGRSPFAKLGREAARFLHRRPLRGAPAGPMVSISFDDAPLSAAQTGAGILEAAGARATFYICGCYADGAADEMAPYADWAMLRTLRDRGHDIACHTYSHRNVARAGPAEALADARRNVAAFKAAGLPAPDTFAFPFGDLSGGAKGALAGDYGLLRATWPGLVGQGSDLNAAPAVAVEGADAAAVGKRWLERAKAETAWLILYSHDVTDRPGPYGCTPEALEAIVDSARGLGVEIVTVAEGLRRLA